MKSDEWVSPDSYPRLVVDLKVPASLQGFRTTELYKKAMASITEVDGEEYQVVIKADYKSVKAAIDKLYEHRTKHFMVIFSDDACLSVWNEEKGQYDRFNLDISKCDASTFDIFKGALITAPPVMRNDFSNLVQQCRSTVKIVPKDKSKAVHLKPKEARMFSGSTLTTGVNGFSGMNIFKSIIEDDSCTAEEIKASAARVGFLYKVEQCHQFKHVTFLKYSPVRDTSFAWQPILNLGVLLRAHGKCRGDLAGRGDFDARANEFNYGLICGMYPRVHTPFLQALCKATGCPDVRPAIKEQLFKQRRYFEETPNRSERYTLLDDPPVVYVTTEEFFSRYDLTPDEIDYMLYTFAPSGLKWHHNSTATDKILLRDYKMHGVSRVSDEPTTMLWAKH
jgi:hypothetical protein